MLKRTPLSSQTTFAFPGKIYSYIGKEVTNNIHKTETNSGFTKRRLPFVRFGTTVVIVDICGVVREVVVIVVVNLGGGGGGSYGLRGGGGGAYSVGGVGCCSTLIGGRIGGFGKL